MELIVRRAFTSVQLRTILEENHHQFLIIEHNPQLYERARDMAGRVADAMLPGLSGRILLYAPALDRHLEAMAEFEDWVFCFMTCSVLSWGGQKHPGDCNQITWEAFSLDGPDGSETYLNI
jgi:hypothetical protein